MKLPNVVRGSVAYILASVVQRGALFVMLPFATRAMSPEEFGRVGIAMSIVQLLNFLFSLGLETAVIRAWYGAKGDRDREAQIAGSASFLLLIGANTLALLILFGAWIAGWPYLGATTWVLTVVSSAVFAVLTALPLALLRAQGRLRDYLTVTAVQAVGVVAGTAILVLAMSSGAAGWVAGSAIGNGLGLLVAARILPWPSMRFRTENAHRTLIRTGFPMIPHLTGQWGLQLSDRVVGTHVLTLAQVGAFTLAFNLVVPLTIIATGISQGMQPLFAKAAVDEKSVPALRRAMTGQILAIGFLGGAVGGYGSLCIGWFFPTEFEAASAVLPILAGGTALWAAYAVPMNTLSLLIGRPAGMWILTFTVLALKTIVVFSVIPNGDLLALTWCFAAANTLLLLGTLTMARRHAAGRAALHLPTLVVPFAWGAALVVAVGFATNLSSGLGVAAVSVALALYATGSWAILSRPCRPAA